MTAASKLWPCPYEIIIAEQIDNHWVGWFDGLALEALPNGQTRISGDLQDQAALRGVLERIFDLNLTLIWLADTTAHH